MNHRRFVCSLPLVALLLLPSLTFAQVSGSIAGTVKDATGAVLPGVTVEVASPTLIEKVRTATSDAEGQYKVIELRPGVYSVSFSLTGFSTVKRDGIEISAGFTATVNADLKVGSVEETITVSGATPIVDIQNSRSQQLLKGEVLDALPNAGKSPLSFIGLTLGAQPSNAGKNDVGGDHGDSASGVTIHGFRGDDGRLKWDGYAVNHFNGGGGGTWRVWSFNPVGIQEVVADTGGNTAEYETGGANYNMVPKDGSNRLSLFGTANYTDDNFSAKAIPDSIAARGVSPQSTLRKVYQYGVGAGGSIIRDKLWFYTSNAWWGSQIYGANNYFNKSTNPLAYVPDTSRPAYTDFFIVDDGVRLTWQAAPKHKFTEDVHLQDSCNCWLSIGGGALSSPDATGDQVSGPNVLSQTTWTNTVTNKLLIQAGVSLVYQGFKTGINNALTTSKFTGYDSTPNIAGTNTISILEQTGGPNTPAPAGYRFGAPAGGTVSSTIVGKGTGNLDRKDEQLTVSYISGSHAFKVGLQMFQGSVDSDTMESTNQVQFIFRNGVPSALQEWAGPFIQQTGIHGEGLFAQDQWTLNRITLNLGLRFDHFYGHALPINNPATPLRAAIQTAEVSNFPNYKDVTWRFGAAYDLFGNGKTAVKFAFGKYVNGQGSYAFAGFVPATAVVNNVTRSWTDANGNFAPDCNLTVLTANGECGQVSNLAFGQPFSNQSLASDVTSGWGAREYSYQWNAQVQHELMPNVGLFVGYFHTQYGNLTVAQNTLVSASDFTSYCITEPTDSRLGSLSGQQVCGYYDINPNKVGQAQYVVTQASHFGSPQDYFDGVDIGVNMRFGKGGVVNGGMTVGRETYDYCYANNRPDLTPENFPFAFSDAINRYPRNAQFCKVQSPWWDAYGSQVKFQAVYPLPYNMAISAVYKNLPGIILTASNPLTSAQVAPFLGRPLAGGAASVNLALLPFTGGNIGSGAVGGAAFDDRLNQLDLRLTKAVRIGRGRIQGILDVYNIFDARTPQADVTTYGATWTRPTSLLGGRLFKFGTQVEW
jgi:hypothetical protein